MRIPSNTAALAAGLFSPMNPWRFGYIGVPSRLRLRVKNSINLRYTGSVFIPRNGRREESRRGTHECVRYVIRSGGRLLGRCVRRGGLGGIRLEPRLIRSRKLIALASPDRLV